MRRLQTHLNSRALIALLLGLTLALADFILRCLPLKGGSLRFFSFTIFHNYGVAFNWHSPAALLVIATSIALTLSAYLLFSSTEFKTALAGSALLTGAGANAAERLIHNYITDYWLLFGISAINLADILIVSGAIYFLWYFKSRRDHTDPVPNPQI